MEGIPFALKTVVVMPRNSGSVVGRWRCRLGRDGLIASRRISSFGVGLWVGLGDWALTLT